MKTKIITLALLLGTLTIGTANAQTLYNIYFPITGVNMNGQTAVAPSTGADLWNNVYTKGHGWGPSDGSTFINTTVYDTNGENGISFATDPFTGYGGNPAAGIPPFTTHGIGAGIEPITLTLSGLDPGTTYSLFLYGINDNQRYNTFFAVNGTNYFLVSGNNDTYAGYAGTTAAAFDYTTFSSVATGARTVADIDNVTTYYGNYLQLDLTPVAGEINLTLFSPVGVSTWNFSAITGLQLYDAIPEPSTYLLLLTGTALLLFLRRRK